MKLSLKKTVAVIGAGSIGVAFTLVFARAGHHVKLYDPDPNSRDVAKPALAERVDGLARYDLISETIDQILSRVQICDNLASAVDGAVYIQECAPENIDLKRRIFAELESCASPEAILASASSAIPASQIVDGLQSKNRCLVTHPGNPPFLIAVIELVPSPETSDEALEFAKSFLSDSGLDPVLVNKEIEGFVFNRLQGALLREAYCLVRDGIASVDDVDKIVRDGLGLRWSFMGPFETADLNTQGGIGAHAKKLGPAYARMAAERGQNDPWSDDLVATVEGQRRRLVPLDQWADRVAWRDDQLMKLVSQRRQSK